MAHEVVFRVPNRSLGKEDIIFDIFDEEGKLGSLRVSKGGVDWRPAHGKLAYRARWLAFSKVMTENVLGRHPR
jgi:hypothetical protein